MRIRRRSTSTWEVASQGESIVVTADRPHGEAEAIERSRNTDNIVQVLSGEVIRSLPNANVADALARLPSVTLFRDEGEGAYVLVRGTEPRLTNTTINGITIASPEANARQVRLDSIPAGLVESVEINKTLAPNMDGDGSRRLGESEDEDSGRHRRLLSACSAAETAFCRDGITIRSMALLASGSGSVKSSAL